jgi:hypothetical protein
MKTDILLDHDITESMVDHLFESMGGSDVKVRLSSADMNPIEGTLAYDIEDVVIETKRGSIRVPSAGVLNLDVDPTELAQKVQKEANGEAIEIVDLKVAQPPDNFKYGRNRAKYTLTASYLTNDGKNQNVDLTFDSIGFEPSPEFTEQVGGLT